MAERQSRTGLIPQAYFPNPAWDKPDARGINAAWYEREIAVPAEWAGRRITLYAGYLNSYAVIYLDGAKVGEIRFPGGEVDLTGICHPGQKHLLSHVCCGPATEGRDDVFQR